MDSSPEGHMGIAVLTCLATACCYVGLLYIWRGGLPRDHPSTIKRRLLSTGLSCCLAWIPVYFSATRLHETSTPVHHLLGLRLAGLPRAVVDTLYLCITLFVGPLVFFVYDLDLDQTTTAPPPPLIPRPAAPLPPGSQAPGDGGSSTDSWSSGFSARTAVAAGSAAGEAQQRHGAAPAAAAAATGGPDGAAWAAVPGTAASGGGGGGVVGWLMAKVRGTAGDLRLWRNLVAAPLTEEWVFRACMAPLLVLEGMSMTRVVLLTPLFFGAAHLHHVAELVRHQRVPLRHALLTVCFQFGYTTIFGWLASFLFLRTGHLAAPLVAHAFCNWAGFPPFGAMAEHPRAILLFLTTIGGVVTFGLQLGRMTAPARYQQDFYIGW